MPDQEAEPKIPYITKRELIQRTGRSQASIQRMMRAGMPFVRYFGGVTLFDYPRVLDWMQDNGLASVQVINALRQGKRSDKVRKTRSDAGQPKKK